MKRKKLYALILSAFLFCGCADPKILEEMGLITTVGYDLSSSQEIITTMSLLQVDPTATPNADIITAKALTSKGGRLQGNRKAPKKLQSGQLRVALFGTELARNGIISLADTLARDPAISDLVYLAIVDGEAANLLNQPNSKNMGNIGQSIYKELEQNVESESIPSSTLQESLRDYHSHVQDSVLPIVSMDNQLISISGLALFRDEKMVGRVDSHDGFYIELLRNRYEAGNIELKMDKDEYEELEPFKSDRDNVGVVLDTIKSKSKIKLKKQSRNKFQVSVSIDARLLEITEGIYIDLEKPKNLHLLEKAISKKFTREIEEVIDLCQSKESDVFGFGETYRSTVGNKGLTRKKWHKLYKDIEVDVKMDFQIVRTGVVE
ncbi:Ger(x)C family spore germination protein [Metabacillus indicus]|uniref:Ger(x)C family spore germination protein n=1 Tax=Metabacillus indicus TaxID=246786 RepID=UPI000492F4CC|nr:Ger(x)C family spore germination protein [Metabacillus indicus]KEZ47001.1 hypothetical protein AZ46_0221265 [Metabacillus indicus LMG 22858]